MTPRIKEHAASVVELHDPLTAIAPMLRVRPELQDFCRFGGSWRTAHKQEEAGWASFHIVTSGACLIEREGEPPDRLEAGDVLLFPHGDGHVVYGGGGRHELRDVATTYRHHIRVKETLGPAIETELVCGRLHLEGVSENLMLRALPSVIVLRLGGELRYLTLVAMIREELDAGRAGAAEIASDLSSALFVMLLRQHLESAPLPRGLLAALAGRETARAAAAMLKDPARDWELDDLAKIAATSRATLVRAFRRFSGMPPKALLTELRLGLARNQILHTSDSLGTIAARVGYRSEAALSRALHNRFGTRPGAMRRTMSENGQRVPTRASAMAVAVEPAV
ncbi:AraC family transcriptional regulator [Sphingomonas sp. PB4P5]|uniref:AraC family transcriptional regulator n=1 Tax=Parasphingomonas puruogangriensis TaxID=3096155 RepID=UPI002FC8F63A